MGELLAVTDFASTWWQYCLLFLAVAASWAGVPLVGAAAAGTAGVAASHHRLNLAAIIVVIVIAGEVGGLVGYYIGSRWGRELVERPGKHQAYREKVLAKGERAYERWGRIAVFFTPSIVSGTAEMPRRQFVIWNALDVLGFAFFTVGGAYGVDRVLTGHHSVKDVAVWVALVAIGATLLYFARRRHKNVSGAPATS